MGGAVSSFRKMQEKRLGSNAKTQTSPNTSGSRTESQTQSVSSMHRSSKELKSPVATTNSISSSLDNSNSCYLKISSTGFSFFKVSVNSESSPFPVQFFPLNQIHSCLLSQEDQTSTK